MKDFIGGSFMMFVILCIGWGAFKLGGFISKNYGEPYTIVYMLAVISVIMGMIFAINQETEKEKDNEKRNTEQN